MTSSLQEFKLEEEMEAINCGQYADALKQRGFIEKGSFARVSDEVSWVVLDGW